MTESGYERIAVVTHGGVIRSMTAHCLGIPMNKWRILGKNLENCSITELNWDGASGRLHWSGSTIMPIWSPIPICCERDGSVLKIRSAQVLYGFRVKACEYGWERNGSGYE